MPQISQLAATYASQIFWLLLTFGLVFFVVGRGMLPRVQATVDARDRSIAGDLAAARAARDEADAAEEAWRMRDAGNREAAQAAVAEGRATIAQTLRARQKKAGDLLAADVTAREGEIAAASTRASAEIEGVAAQAAQDIVVRLSGITVPADDARTAVRAALHG